MSQACGHSYECSLLGVTTLLRRHYGRDKLTGMQHTLHRPPLVNAPDLEAAPTFSVVIAYEDFETGKHAKRTYDFLVENLGREYNFVNQMWKFEVLTIPKLREIAAEDAAKADIIIISSHGRELPDQTKIWIESWLEQPRNPLALVALFDSPWRYETNDVRDYLAEVARRGEMEFFAQDESATGMKRYNSEETTRSGAPTSETLSVLAEVIDEARGCSSFGK